MWRSVLLFAGAVLAGEITPRECRNRRQALRQELNDGVTILIGATEDQRGNLRSPFFQESNFYYLTGWSEPGAIIVLAPAREVLFIPRRDPEREKWTGPKADPIASGIRELTGFDQVEAAETFESQLAGLVEAAPKVYTLLGQPYSDRLKSLLPLREFADASTAIAKLRMRKSPAELALIRRATEVTMEAHRAAWKRLAPGLYEYQLAATMSAVYLDAGCARPAYSPIVGSGPAATILHYSSLRRRIQSGELVLMDVGAECSRYATDITRTVPASGRFTKRQRELYEIVLGAQQAVLAAVKPGMTLSKEGPNSLYRIALDYLNSHRADGIEGGLGRYFTHGIGHHVGLDVHDANDPERPLAPGMVITIEPGLYIPEENVGIRIEDVVLVTETGAELLTAALPRQPEEIEKALRKGN